MFRRLYSQVEESLSLCSPCRPCAPTGGTGLLLSHYAAWLAYLPGSRMRGVETRHSQCTVSVSINGLRALFDPTMALIMEPLSENVFKQLPGTTRSSQKLPAET